MLSKLYTAVKPHFVEFLTGTYRPDERAILHPENAIRPAQCSLKGVSGGARNFPTAYPHNQLFKVWLPTLRLEPESWPVTDIKGSFRARYAAAQLFTASLTVFMESCTGRMSVLNV